MSHMIEKMDLAGFRGQPAWHSLGIVFDAIMSGAQAVAQFLPYWVEMVRLEVNGVQTDHYALQRKDDTGYGPVYGFSSEHYEVLQPRDLGEEVDTFIELAANAGHKVEVETCFSMQSGKRALIQLRVPSLDFSTGEGDAYGHFVAWHTTYDAKSATDAHCGTTRIVCNNTYMGSLGRAGKRGSGVVSIRHSANQKVRLAILRDTLLEVLANFDTQRTNLKSLYNANLKVSKEEIFKAACDQVLPLRAKKVSTVTVDTKAAQEQAALVSEMVARAKENDTVVGSQLVEILAANSALATVATQTAEETSDILQVRRASFLDACLRAWEIESAQDGAGSSYVALQAVSDVLQHRDSYTKATRRGSEIQRAENEYLDVLGLSGKTQTIQDSVLNLILENSL